MRRSCIGIQIGATTAAGELGAVAAEAERFGYGEIWLAEDYFQLGGISSAALALSATKEIPVGLGVVAAVARHPAVTAMEFATLGCAHPGRFMGGFGHGAPGWVRQMGLQPKSPLRSLREAVGATQALLAGEELTHNGDYFDFDRVRLAPPPGVRVPLYLGVHGPASLRLSGELADGTLLGWFSSPGYVAWARGRLAEGRESAGRHDPHELVVLCLLSLSRDDPTTAIAQLGAWAAPMLAGMVDAPQLTVSSEGEELRALLTGEPDAAPSVPPSLLGQFVACGDVADCAATVDRLLEAGADRVVLVPNPAGYRSTAAMVEQLQLASAIVADR